MDGLFTLVYYGAAGILLALSLGRDREKTRLALRRAGGLFLTVLSQFVAICLITGLLLAAASPPDVQAVMGAESGVKGMLLCALAGSAALIPVLAAYPVVAQLLQNGAGLSQMALFIAALTTVGLISLPLEGRYLGKQAALLRNLLFLLFGFLNAMVLEAVLG